VRVFGIGEIVVCVINMLSDIVYQVLKTISKVNCHASALDNRYDN
jgi:hypothetical protein